MIQGKPQKDLSKTTLPYWPGMYNCFQSLRKLNDCIKKESTRTNGGLGAEEASYLETKLQIIKCFLFNSPDAHKSMYKTPLLLFCYIVLLNINSVHTSANPRRQSLWSLISLHSCTSPSTN